MLEAMGRFGRPFRGSVAIAARRLTAHELDRDHRRIYRDVYVHKEVDVTARVRALAAAEFAGPTSILVGMSAAAMHSTKYLAADDPAEVVRDGNYKAPPGMIARHYVLAEDEVQLRHDGIRVTTPARTAFDLGRRLPRQDAVVVLDALCHATDLKPAEIEAVMMRYPGARGVRRLREILPIIDGKAESPPESLTRLLLIDAGLPHPDTQVYVFDKFGGFIARCDMGWREWKVIVEYDGEDHWTRARRANDIERYALLEELGWVVVRVGADLLNRHPGVLVDRVRKKLRAAGARV